MSRTDVRLVYGRPGGSKKVHVCWASSHEVASGQTVYLIGSYAAALCGYVPGKGGWTTMRRFYRDELCPRCKQELLARKGEKGVTLDAVQVDDRPKVEQLKLGGF